MWSGWLRWGAVALSGGAAAAATFYLSQADSDPALQLLPFAGWVLFVFRFAPPRASATRRPMRRAPLKSRAASQRRFGIVTAVGFLIACVATAVGLAQGVSVTAIAGVWGALVCATQIGYLRLPPE